MVPFVVELIYASIWFVTIAAWLVKVQYRDLMP